MIEDPPLVLSAEAARRWGAEGPLAGRALDVAQSVAARLAAASIPLTPAHLEIERAPAEHVGLGVGTQICLAVARVLYAVAGLADPAVAELSALTGRGQRSGIGLHGSVHGGLIVDGGRRGPEGVPPLLAQLPFPPEWAILVVQPRPFTGLHGPAERRAFAALPPVADAVTDRLCRLVLLGLLPAVLERDLDAFGAALAELQQRVGQCFAPAQGGLYAHPELEAIVASLRALGLHGVGQSSWGPTLYGFSAAGPDERRRLLEQAQARFQLPDDALFWTSASAGGSRLEAIV
jgi:beta-RFAP synthase